VIFPLFLPMLGNGSQIPAHIAAAVSETRRNSVYWLWYVTYSVDFLVGWKGFIFPSHPWSLAVEEHFYLLWPLLIYRFQRSTLIKVTAALAIGTPLLRCCLLKAVGPVAVYACTPFRMDGLAMGSMIALVLCEENGLASLRKFGSIFLPIFSVLWAAMFFGQHGTFGQFGFLQQTIGYSVTSVLFASLLMVTLTRKAWAGAFSNSVLRWFGKYSYAMYIVHFMVLHYLATLFRLGDPAHFSVIDDVLLKGRTILPGREWVAPVLDGACFAILSVGITLIGGVASWRLIELPFLHLKRFFPYDNRPLVTGAALVHPLAQDAGAVLSADKAG
jgi:peptidoglycan/LPS O-acetylase OafA/YrhL